MKEAQWRMWLGFSFAFLILGLMIVSSTATAVSKTLGATGDACTINLPDGLKEPGTVTDGKCCSVLHTDRCYDIPKPNVASKAALATKGVKRAEIVVPTATPTPRKGMPAAGKAKIATPTPTPTPK